MYESHLYIYINHAHINSIILRLAMWNYVAIGLTYRNASSNHYMYLGTCT
jgi:hypothetical protein